MKYLFLILMVCSLGLFAQEDLPTQAELDAMDAENEVVFVLPTLVLAEIVHPTMIENVFLTAEDIATLTMDNQMIGTSTIGTSSLGTSTIDTNYINSILIGTNTISLDSLGLGTGNTVVTEADVIKALMARTNTVNTVMMKTKRIRTAKILEPSLDEYMAFKSSTSFIKDRYTKTGDKGFRKKNRGMFKKWKAFNKKKFKTIKYIPFTDTKLKMLAEIRKEGNKKNLRAELKYFKKMGYNAVLACWRGGGTNPLIKRIKIAKKLGYKVWFTFGGKESVSTPIYLPPKMYGKRLQELAKLCDGFVLGWRRSSRHLFQPEKGWTNYTLQQVRKGNKKILLFGEVYFDYNSETRKHGDVAYNIPANMSGVITVNCGVGNSYAKGIMKFVRKKTSLSLINVVVGEKPYYMSRNNTHKTKTVNRSIITRIEKRFISAGFAGTITLSGDGSDGNYPPNITDNVAQSEWHVTNGE